MSASLTRKSFFHFSIALATGCSLLAVLASCTTSSREPPKMQQLAVSKSTPLPPATDNMELVSAGRYSQCVPYARDYSGIQIFGDAWTWWAKADGRYDRGSVPRRGSVLALKKTERLNIGHVAVVAAVIEPRKILVDHANWSDNPGMRRKIYLRQPVIDVSPKNDWSVVRFMNTQGTFGGLYPAHGFIYSDTEIRTAQN
jgi:surface antigen